MKEFLTTGNIFLKRKYPSASIKIILVLILISLTGTMAFAGNYSRYDCVKQINCPRCTAYVIGYDTYGTEGDLRQHRMLIKEFDDLLDNNPKKIRNQLVSDHTNGYTAHLSGKGELYDRPHKPLRNIKGGSFKAVNHETAAYNTPEVDAYNQAFKCNARLSAAGYDDARIAENMNEVMNFLQSDYRAVGSGDKNGIADAYLHGWYDSSNGLPNHAVKTGAGIIK